ncbi:putative MATE family efflux protein [Hydrogenoanaerobacterium saccharovorans]|uniref:Probable multidrug resistance protein NorM n=1 Tax=Hydrogenoanaerobacterium saccharovorans TaxID=474960 RepID=A0A1H7YR98_9FIRM|nr:MATE family efflux transporter [Hydrogenoanaerobacterium saccharovorans]RPF49069.1 putative MATE family efflux protein [Hydrogenoanaerobacterium saccharovorans]SEM48513.1 putative efflux protein, MATE family [Hydrogenoanaerobacterium saccharovorans]
METTSKPELEEKHEKKHTMISGNPTRAIITFAIPMILGNIFQQLYNTADAVIVGQFIGENALASVGVANPIMSIVIFFIFGICVGMSVLMAQLYGAKDYSGFKKEASTSLIAGLVFTVVLSVLCCILSKPILVLTKTPAEILNDADLYLKIIFIGLIFSFLYNYYSAALRAIGDSKTPFLFLLLSSVLNVVLDIFFIKVLHTGVEGAAIATVISQAVSSILCVIYVYRKIPLLALKRNEFIFEKSILVKTINYSWVSAVQQTFLYVGRLLVQGAVNPFGTSVIAAYNAATRVEGFVLAPFDSMSASTSTYCAQNMGAGLNHRMKSGYKICTVINVIYSLVACAVLFFFSPQIMALFVNANESASVITVGCEYLQLMAFFYILAGMTYIMQGFFRGVGKLKITMITTGSQILIRVILSYILVPKFGVSGVCYATLVGWIFMFLFEGTCAKQYFKQINA